MVQQVKRFVSGFILEPFVMSPTQSLAELDQLKDTKGARDPRRFDVSVDDEKSLEL